MSVIGAIALPLLIGMTGLVADYGHGVLVKTQNQRIADLAAYAGATVYNTTGSTDLMTAAIDNVAALNGISSTAVTGSLVTSPSGDGSQAVKVAINTSLPVYLASVLGGGNQIQVAVAAYAELKANAQGCIIALNTGGTGVTLSGGTSVTASGCAVDSNTSVTVPCGDTITTIAVNYDGAAPSEPCNGIQPPSGHSLHIVKALTADPLSGNSGVTTATSRLATVAALTSPGAPTVPGGGNIAFAYSVSTTQSEASADGCAASYASDTWTLTCPSGGTYNFGNITTGGGITVNFNTSGSASTTYNFNSINNTGTAMHFGPGTFNIAKGLYTGGGTTTTFGAGAFNIGEGAGACNGGGKYSICNTGTTLSFGGPSSFTLQGGIYNKGGESITFGAGSTNSYVIGASSDGNAFYAGGGAVTWFSDATGSGDLFQMAGNLNVASGGGSCLNLPAAAQHDINGYFSTAGGTILGAGVYTVHGYISLGGNGGGDVTCWGSDVGMYGAGVTLVTDGSSLPSSGSCAGAAFCLAAGYDNVTLTAPSSGTTAQLAVIGPQSTTNTATATFTEGASNTSVSGAFYFPNGPVNLSGAATLGNGSGQCLELIGSQVTLAGGSAVASTCVGSGAVTSTAVLVQ
ncbi:MAG TPA: pilus assembly protein TadG-related protein [Caulobacteraceae bacterium]|nr:pilus assembly protein TadG-related protein [Caulobacteraceae bacterium]